MQCRLSISRLSKVCSVGLGAVQERHNLRTGTITIGIKGCCGSAGRDTAGYSPLHHVGIIAVRNSGYTFGTRKDYPA